MKKLLFLLLILMLTTGCSISTLNITEIDIINPVGNEKITVDRDSGTAKTIIAAINKKEKIDYDISSLFAYEITLKKKNEIEGYIISFDVENESVYISKDDSIYKVNKDVAKDLLIDDNFAYVYLDNTLSPIFLYNNGEEINPNIQYEWSFEDIEGQLIKKTGGLSDGSGKIKLGYSDKIDVQFDEKPDSQTASVYSKGEILFTGKSITDVIDSINTDGEFFIEIQYKWNQKNNKNYYGNQTVSFMAEVDRPADFSVITKENYPGNIMVVYVKNINKDETVKLMTDAVKTEVKAYSYKDNYVSIMPIDLYTKIGEHDIYAIFDEGKKTERKITKEITISGKNFKTQYLNVSEALNDNNNDDKAIEEFVRCVKPAREVSAKEKLWDGEFLMPVEGTLTTDYAEIRYVNNEISSSRHSGVDLAAPIGTEIKAPNNGKVTLAVNGLLSSGNTLVIDHGMGLFTSYYHLDTILVKEGNEVKKGDIIGTVGTTGFSTGPHLHYAVSIFNTYVNTYQPMNGIFN